MARIGKASEEWTVAFASGRDGILADGLNIDGRFYAGREIDGRLSQYLAGDVTSIWLKGELQFVADRPVDITWKLAAKGKRVTISARDGAWVRFRSDRPASPRLNGRDCNCQHDEATGMIWLRVPAGKSELEIHSGRRQDD